LAFVTRKRTIPFQGVMKSNLDTFETGNPLNTTHDKRESKFDQTYAPLNGTQITVSENHPKWNDPAYRRRHPLEDLGGEFTSTKRYAYLSGNTDPRRIEGSEPVGIGTRTNVAIYNGAILPTPPNNMPFPPYANSSDASLRTLGTTAIARCSPSNPSADLSTFLGELSGEGIPKIAGGSIKSLHSIVDSLKSLRYMSNRQRRKALAKEHLSLQFGWLPFVSDIRQLVNALDHATKIVSQYERDSGKLVRRKYDFPVDVSQSSMVWQDKVDPWITPYSNVLTDDLRPVTSQVIRTSTVTKLRWFRGAFTYYIPPSSNRLIEGDIAEKVILAKKLVGARLTPDAIWNLAPWSWAVDWFSNVGDLSQNLDNWIVDNQVLVYGYMMERTLSEYTYTFVGPGRFWSGAAYPPSVHCVSETQRRIKATPYGFGLNWSGLSALQQSILVALGMSKWR